MKIALLFLAAYAGSGLISSFGLKAQNVPLLSKYTYTANQKIIGQLRWPVKSGPIPNVELVGESARIFSLHKNQLSFQKKMPSTDQRFWFDVVLKYRSPQGTAQDTLRIVKDDFFRNQVIAHRGAWKNTGATENSIGALQHAIKLGCSGSEFDVHMSSDSVLFIHHDPTIEGISIEKTPAAELSKLKLADGENLPTLAAYLQEGTRQNKTRLILEIKASVIGKERSLALAEKVVKMVRKYRAQGWVDYISFDFDILKKIQELDPYAKVAYLNGDKAPSELAQHQFYGFDYNVKVMQKNENWIDEAHQHKLTVNVWTVNDEKLMDWLLSKKVEFITTNEPELLLQKIKKPAPGNAKF